MLLYGGAGAILWLVPLAEFVRLTLFVALVAACYVALVDHALRRSRRAIVKIEIDEDGEWSLYRRGSEKSIPVVVRDRWVQPGLVLLRLATEEKRRLRLVIVQDAVAAEPLRRLRVRLRLRTAAG